MKQNIFVATVTALGMLGCSAAFAHTPDSTQNVNVPAPSVQMPAQGSDLLNQVAQLNQAKITLAHQMLNASDSQTSALAQQVLRDCQTDTAMLDGMGLNLGNTGNAATFNGDVGTYNNGMNNGVGTYNNGVGTYNSGVRPSNESVNGASSYGNDSNFAWNHDNGVGTSNYGTAPSETNGYYGQNNQGNLGGVNGGQGWMNQNNDMGNGINGQPGNVPAINPNTSVNTNGSTNTNGTPWGNNSYGNSSGLNTLGFIDPATLGIAGYQGLQGLSGSERDQAFVSDVVAIDRQQQSLLHQCALENPQMQPSCSDLFNRVHQDLINAKDALNSSGTILER